MSGLILDVVIAVIVLLFVIFGVWRGMYKLIYGLVSNLAAIVLAVVLASTVTTFVINKTSLDEYVFKWLDEPIQKAIPAQLDASNVVIDVYAVPDENGRQYVVRHDATEYDSIGEVFTETGGSLSFVYKLAGNLVESMVKNENNLKMLNPEYGEEGGETKTITLAQVISTTAIVYIMLAAVFLLLWIVAYIVMRLLMYVIKKIVHGTYVGHFLDKVLGLVIGAAFAMLIIWGALAIIRLLGTYTWIIPVNELIESSTITKILYNNNYIYNFLVNSADLQKSIADLIGRFSSSSATPATDTETAARVVADVTRVAAGV